MERGNLTGASDAVLDGIASALQLDEAERAHLFDLARAAQPAPPRQRRAKTSGVTDGIQQILDAITDAPAWVRNARHDLLAANRLARALYSPVLADPRRPANNARFVYLDPAAREFFADWERAADDIAAMLRSEAGSNPRDKHLVELIGELSTRSEEFRTRWAAHNVRFHRTGTKHLHHAIVGDLDMTFEAMELPADPGLTMLAYSAEPGSPTQEGSICLRAGRPPRTRPLPKGARPPGSRGPEYPRRPDASPAPPRQEVAEKGDVVGVPELAEDPEAEERQRLRPSAPVRGFAGGAGEPCPRRRGRADAGHGRQHEHAGGQRKSAAAHLGPALRCVPAPDTRRCPMACPRLASPAACPGPPGGDSRSRGASTGGSALDRGSPDLPGA
jgi:hypothetical protein